LLLVAHVVADEGCPFAFLTPERFQRIQARWQRFYREGRATEWQNRLVCNNALRKFKRRCRDAGIATTLKLTIHCLRKSFAQNLADNGTPIHTLMKLMGHSSIKTLEQFYIRSSDANETKACNVLDELLPAKTKIKLTVSG
jgi:integrase